MFKVAYVLISGDEDFYTEQFIISISTLKFHNPEVEVVLLTDKETEQRLRTKYPNITSSISEIKGIYFESDVKPIYRSRFLKTNLINYIDADTLFVDTDTVILANIADITFGNLLIGAVEDLHQKDLSTCRYIDMIKTAMKRIGWKPFDLNTKYYNSGILVIRNNEETRNFFSKWHENWLYSASKGVMQDQLALNYTNSKEKIIRHINPIFHCQIFGNGLRFLNNARIIHYFNSSKRNYLGEKPLLIMEEDTLLDIRKEGHVSDELMQRLNQLEKLFPEQIDIICGENIPVFHSDIFGSLVNLHFYHPGIFDFLERIVKIYKKFKNKLSIKRVK